MYICKACCHNEYSPKLILFHYQYTSVLYLSCVQCLRILMPLERYPCYFFTFVSNGFLDFPDEPALLDIYRTVLKKTGYNVTTWNDSIKALSNFKEDLSLFDCVLTDYSMPHLSGRELYEQLLEIRPDLPIIILTGQSETFGPN